MPKYKVVRKPRMVRFSKKEWEAVAEVATRSKAEFVREAVAEKIKRTKRQVI